MNKYIILSGSVENDMPDGYLNEVVVYLGTICSDEEIPHKEIPELLYNIHKHNGRDLEADELKTTAENSEFIKVLKVSDEEKLTPEELSIEDYDTNKKKSNN